MGEVISGMTGPQLTGFVGMVGGLISVTVILIACIALPFLTWARRVEAVTQLKRDLAVAGFSAADIERVVRATPGDPISAPSTAPSRCRVTA